MPTGGQSNDQHTNEQFREWAEAAPRSWPDRAIRSHLPPGPVSPRSNWIAMVFEINRKGRNFPRRHFLRCSEKMLKISKRYPSVQARVILFDNNSLTSANRRNDKKILKGIV